MLGKDYKAQGPYAQEILDQEEAEMPDPEPKKESPEEPIQTLHPAMILPPLPSAIVDALRSYKDVNQKPQ